MKIIMFLIKPKLFITARNECKMEMNIYIRIVRLLPSVNGQEHFIETE